MRSSLIADGLALGASEYVQPVRELQLASLPIVPDNCPRDMARIAHLLLRRKVQSKPRFSRFEMIPRRARHKTETTLSK
jgi:hypothetical protein